MPHLKHSPNARQTSKVHRSLHAQFTASAEASAASGSVHVPEVHVNGAMETGDDAASTAPSNISSTVSLFAGGTREVDVYLRSTRTGIDANMAQWLEKRIAFGERSQDQIVTTHNEELIQRAEDIETARPAR